LSEELAMAELVEALKFPITKEARNCIDKCKKRKRNEGTSLPKYMEN